jgi:hypothetical protein
VEDVHERTHEVDGVGIRAEITAGDGVLDGGHEGGVNERPGITTYHAVQEEGVLLQNIAETIGKGLKVPVVSISAEQAGEHFGMFFGHAATLDMPASSEWTRKTLRWEPTGPGLIEDLTLMKYCSRGACF